MKKNICIVPAFHKHVRHFRHVKILYLRHRHFHCPLSFHAKYIMRRVTDSHLAIVCCIWPTLPMTRNTVLINSTLCSLFSSAVRVSLVNTCDKFTNVIDVIHVYHVSEFVARVNK